MMTRTLTENDEHAVVFAGIERGGTPKVAAALHVLVHIHLHDICHRCIVAFRALGWLRAEPYFVDGMLIHARSPYLYLCMCVSVAAATAAAAAAVSPSSLCSFVDSTNNSVLSALVDHWLGFSCIAFNIQNQNVVMYKVYATCLRRNEVQTKLNDRWTWVGLDNPSRE
ncbi:hypothetical protein F4777DRAFT_156123 [Nemania sp. FL0916]|nr:hypothetical protein F4777DRAFT_156123 [Nemania sp. FL0916]